MVIDKNAKKNKCRVFERKILRKIFGPICDNGNWCIRYNDEFYKAYGDTDMVKTRLRWLVHLYREKETVQCRKVILNKIDGKSKVGRPNIR